MGPCLIERIAAQPRRHWPQCGQRPRSTAGGSGSHPSLLGRRWRDLRDYDKSIRAADVHGRVISAEVDDAIEAVVCETARQLLARPASHHELVVAGTFLAVADEDVALGQEKAPVLPIERSDAREGEPPAIGVDTLSEERLPILPPG